VAPEQPLPANVVELRVGYGVEAMGDEIEVRRASPLEREVLVGLWLSLIEHHRRLDPDYPLPPELRAGLRSEIDRGLTRPGCAIWLAEVCARDPSAKSIPVGFAFAEADAHSRRGDDEAAVGWIHELWVDPMFRRRGVASRLVEQACAFLAERGGRIAVRVEAANAIALAFWQARGFRARAHVLERTGA
jgi:ribosomal protein S18 acetylase RimI-like enzyme